MNICNYSTVGLRHRTTQRTPGYAMMQVKTRFATSGQQINLLIMYSRSRRPISRKLNGLLGLYSIVFYFYKCISYIYYENNMLVWSSNLKFCTSPGWYRPKIKQINKFAAMVKIWNHFKKWFKVISLMSMICDFWFDFYFYNFFYSGKLSLDHVAFFRDGW